MARLLRQNAYVARHNGLLWLICAVMFIVSALARLDAYTELGVVPGLGIVIAFFAAVYLGDAGTSGRLDNQIISGAPRFKIYLSGWLIMTACALLMLLFTLAGDLLGGLAMGTLNIDFLGWLVYLGGMAVNTAAYTALFTFICLLCTGRRAGRATIALILCAVLFIGMAIWASAIDNKLTEPEFYTEMPLPYGGSEVSMEVGVYDPAEVSNPEDLIPNPYYVGEPERSRYFAILHFIPFAQTLTLAQGLINVPPTWDTAGFVVEIVLDGLILILATSALGMLLFRGRELD